MTHCKTEAIKNKAAVSKQVGFAVVPALLSVLVMIAVMASVWQWERAQQHDALTQDAVKSQSSMTIKNLNQESPDEAMNVKVSGVWLANSTVYISPRLIEGRLGALLVSILKYHDFEGKVRYLAVQRGWAAQSFANKIPVSNPLSTSSVDLEGDLVQHVSRAIELQTFKPTTLGLWQNHSMSAHGELLSVQLEPQVLVLSDRSDDADAASLHRVPAQMLVDTLKQKADSNRGYAFQWLALATVGLFGLIVMWRNRIKK